VSAETLTNTADSTFVLGSCVVLSLLQIANRARLPSQMSLLGGKSMASNEGRSPGKTGTKCTPTKALEAEPRSQHDWCDPPATLPVAVKVPGQAECNGVWAGVSTAKIPQLSAHSTRQPLERVVRPITSDPSRAKPGIPKSGPLCWLTCGLRSPKVKNLASAVHGYFCIFLPTSAFDTPPPFQLDQVNTAMRIPVGLRLYETSATGALR
jgi:hypothetical protein